MSTMTDAQGKLEARALRMLAAGDSVKDTAVTTGLSKDAVEQLQRDMPRAAAPRPRPASPGGAAGTVGAPGPITSLPVRVLAAHPGNVRKDLGDLTEMTQTVMAQGILQPLLVTHDEQNRGSYVVIAGHRRLAAALAAGLDRVPVVVRPRLVGTDATEAMLVENLQRADLHPLDEAAAYAQLIEQGRTRDEIGRAVGKSPSYLSDRIALNRLTDAEKAELRAGGLRISEAVQVGRSRNSNRLAPGQQRVKPRKVPHFTVAHPLAETAGARCEHETSLKLGIACGPCWEQSIRDDERRRLARQTGTS